MAVNPIARDFCCIKVQQALDSITGVNTPEFLRQETNGFMSALMSDNNTSGFSQVQTQIGNTGKGPGTTGSNFRTSVEYRMRSCTTSVDVIPSLCDDGAETNSDIIASEVTVECSKSQEFWLNKEEFRQLCESPTDLQRDLLRDKIADLKRDINDDLITKYLTGLGNYYTNPGDVPVDSGLNPKTLLLFNASAQTNGLAMSPLFADYRKSGFSRAPIVVGGDMFERWQRAQNLFVGNDEGLDTGRMNTPPNWIDYAVDQIIAVPGQQNLLSWVPGYIQFLEWTQFPAGSAYEELKEDYQQTTITVDGMTFDFSVNYDKCLGKWHFIITKIYDLFKTPPEAFNTVAPCNQQSNGCLQWIADCGDLDCNYIKL